MFITNLSLFDRFLIKKEEWAGVGGGEVTVSVNFQAWYLTKEFDFGIVCLPEFPPLKLSENVN